MGKLKYDEDSIQTFGVMEGIRAKSGMYLGATDNHGIFTIVREALDNCVDEFHAKRNKLVHIAIEDKVIYVLDEGNGIPVGKHKKEKKSTLTVILTQLHAGGKFNDKTYAYSGGTHGLGITITNAMSIYFKVWTKPKGKKDWYSTEFSKGKEISPVLKTKLTKKDLPNGMKIPKHGTIIAFTPDKTVFDKKAKLDIKHIIEWADLTAYINGGLKVRLTDKGKTTEFFHKGGISDYIDEHVKLLKVTPLGSTFTIKSDTVDLALKFTDYDGEKIEAYTNSVRNIDGGTHLTAFYASLAKTLKPYALKSHNFVSTDLREGIVGLLNYKISSPKFNSQTKEKLVDDRVKEPASKTFEKELSGFFKKNKSLAKQLCCRAHELRNARQEFTMSKKAALKLKPKKGQKSLLPGKFMECRSCSPDDRVLFLVEGDSAAGPAKLARNLKYQEVLPLKGKILNVLKVKQEQKIWDNEEVMNILIAIGYKPNTKSPLDNLRVGKLVLLSDPDPDGPLHGDTRVLTLDGKNPTIRQLAEDWKKNKESFWVYSKDRVGTLVATLAIAPIEVLQTKDAIRIHFDNGTHIDCSNGHKWVTIKPDSRSRLLGGHHYIMACHLRIDDTLDSVLIDPKWEKGVNCSVKELRGLTGINYISGKTQHRILHIEKLTYKDPEPYYCMNVPRTGNFMVDDGKGNGVLSSNCHINLLALTLLAKYLPGMFSRKMVHIIEAPEFVLYAKKKTYYGDTLNDLRKEVPKGTDMSKVVHIKGWGEVEPQVLRELAMDEKTARITLIEQPSRKEMKEFINIMGVSTETRKKLLGI